MRVLLLPIVALLAATACSAQQSAEPAPAPGVEAAGAPLHPVSGLEVIPLTVTTIGGERHEFRVEVARTPREQAQGLMFRTEMGADEGMLFPRDPPTPAGFWMKNTVLSLDLVFIGADGRVLNVEADAVPYSEETLLSDGAAAAVLELNAGRAKQLGIGPGARVEW